MILFIILNAVEAIVGLTKNLSYSYYFVGRVLPGFSYLYKSIQVAIMSLLYLSKAAAVIYVSLIPYFIILLRIS